LSIAGVPDWLPLTTPVPPARYFIWATGNSVDARVFVRGSEWLPKLLSECNAALRGRSDEPDPAPADLDAPTAVVVIHATEQSGGVGHGSLARPSSELRFSLGDLLYLAKLDLTTRLRLLQ
jgi:hypothetical protein